MSTLVRKHVERVIGPGPHTIRHDLDTQWVYVHVYDQGLAEWMPASLEHHDPNTCVLTLWSALNLDPDQPARKPIENDAFTVVVIG